MGGSPFCPFCKGAISADLAQFGGNCPHCLLEVPGEDAPTDPGALLRAKQAVEEEKTRKAATGRRRLRYAAVGVLAMLAVAVGGWYTWSQQQLATYELDDYYVVPVEELASAPVPTSATPTATPTTGESTTSRKTSGGQKSGTTVATSSAPPAIAARTDTRDAIPAEVMAMTTGTTGSVALGANVSLDLGTPGLVLESDEDIIAMAKQVINRSSPQLQACYQQRLRQVSDLAGAWKVEFVITEAGGVRSIDVEGTDRADGELESCITRAISGWKFTKIAHDQRVAKTYRFKPAGG